MLTDIVTLHPVHFMNAGSVPGATDPEAKQTDLSCESTCKLLLSK